MSNLNILIQNYIGNEIFPILGIISVANKQAYEPTIQEITALFYEQPPKRHNLPFAYATSSTNILSMYHQEPSEEIGKHSNEIIKYLKNVGWIEVNNDNRIRITSFGQALIKGIPEQTENDDFSFSTIFKAEDPLVYGKLAQVLSDKKYELLVDPYFKFDYINLFENTSIRKFIIRDTVRKKANEEIAKIQLGLWGLQQQGQNDYEFRTAKAEEMHDRFLKDVDGKVYTLGASINSIGKHTSMMFECPQPLQNEAASYIQRLWESATSIKPKSPSTDKTLENN